MNLNRFVPPALLLLSLSFLLESTGNLYFVRQERVAIEALQAKTLHPGDVITFTSAEGKQVRISIPEAQKIDLDSYQRGLQDGLDLGFENCGQMLKQAQEEMKKYPESKDVTVTELFALLETLNDNIRAGLKERAETEPKLSSGKIKL